MDAKYARHRSSTRPRPALEDVERPLGTHRLRGRLPTDAHTLRWYYGLVIDPYPLTIRRADGRLIVEEIGGDAWSRTIDVSGQFEAPRVNATIAGLAVAGLMLIPIRDQIHHEGHERTRAKLRGFVALRSQ